MATVSNSATGHTAATTIDLKRVAELVESHCEFDRRGGPPVVIVNWAGAAVITSTIARKVFWAGIALRVLAAGELLANIIILRDRYGKGLAYTNLKKLTQDVLKALTNDGIAIVCSAIEPAEIERVRCEERGHLIQFGLERKAQANQHGSAWYEGLYDRPEAKLFVKGLQRRGNTLYETDCKVSIVNEFAMKINDGQWLKYDIAADAARAWITAYFRGVGKHLGRETLLNFRPVLHGRVAKEAFRDATVGAALGTGSRV